MGRDLLLVRRLLFAIRFSPQPVIQNGTMKQFIGEGTRIDRALSGVRSLAARPNSRPFLREGTGTFLGILGRAYRLVERLRQLQGLREVQLPPELEHLLDALDRKRGVGANLLSYLDAAGHQLVRFHDFLD